MGSSLGYKVFEAGFEYQEAKPCYLPDRSWQKMTNYVFVKSHLRRDGDKNDPLVAFLTQGPQNAGNHSQFRALLFISQRVKLWG